MNLLGNTFSRTIVSRIKSFVITISASATGNRTATTSVHGSGAARACRAAGAQGGAGACGAAGFSGSCAEGAGVVVFALRTRYIRSS